MKIPDQLKHSENSSQTNKTSIYSIALNSLEGKTIQFSDYKGKFILLVNVASKCGFTPQYKQLQELQDQYLEKLIVIGLPCNQFGGQEPGDAQTIQTFCERNFGVSFLITEKLNVKGINQHPIYEWLTKKEQNGKKQSTVRWNFQKYLVNDKGELVDFFYSLTKPNSSKITKHLK
jgi:glutathione peroxidase